MIIARLKDNCCPGCRSPLRFDILEAMHRCTQTLRAGCQFAITAAAFDARVKQLYSGHYRKNRSDEDNMAALNNLGHEVRSEDYSDQP